MKKIAVFLLVAFLAACAAPVVEAPTVGVMDPTPQPTTVTSEPTTVLPAFDSTLFVDSAGRFTLEYPESWEVIGGEAGARGDYVQIASWDPGAAGVEDVPRGESLLQIAVYQWDPKADLPARLEMRTTAFANSGIQIAERSDVAYASGPDAVRMRLVSNGEESLVYFFVIGDEYLEISGSGDLQLIDQVVATFQYSN